MNFKTVLKKALRAPLSLLLIAAVVVLSPDVVLANGIDSITGTSTATYNWPWTQFLYALAKELSGPLPMVLGVIAIAGAAFALFAGHGGPGTQRFFVLIFAIGICLFAPNFMTYIKNSAGAATVSELLTVLP